MVVISQQGLVGLGALMGVRGTLSPIKSCLDGDGGAGRAAHRQKASVTGLFSVVPQNFGQVT